MSAGRRLLGESYEDHMARQRADYYGSLPENLPASGSAPFHIKGVLGEASGSSDADVRAALARVAGKSAQRPSIFTKHGFVSQGGFKPPMPITQSGVHPGSPPVSFARDADYAPGTKSFLDMLASNTANLMPALGQHAGPGFHGGKFDPNAPIGTPDMPGGRIPYGSTMIPGGQPGSYWDPKPLGGWSAEGQRAAAQRKAYEDAVNEYSDRSYDMMRFLDDSRGKAAHREGGPAWDPKPLGGWNPNIPLGSTMIPGGQPGSYWDPKPLGGWGEQLFEQVPPDHHTPPVWSRPEYFQERGVPLGAGSDPFNNPLIVALMRLLGGE